MLKRLLNSDTGTADHIMSWIKTHVTPTLINRYDDRYLTELLGGVVLSPSADLTLVQRLRRRPNVESTLCEHPII